MGYPQGFENPQGYKGSCKPKTCPTNSENETKNMRDGCDCKAGYTRHEKAANGEKLIECSSAKCPDTADEAWGRSFRAGGFWFKPSPYDRKNVVDGCTCLKGTIDMVGAIAKAKNEKGYTDTCKCPSNSARAKRSKDPTCKCLEGHVQSGNASEGCQPARCPAFSTGGDIVTTGCLCKPEFPGSVTKAANTLGYVATCNGVCDSCVYSSLTGCKYNAEKGICMYRDFESCYAPSDQTKKETSFCSPKSAESADARTKSGVRYVTTSVLTLLVAVTAHATVCEY